MPKTPPHSPKKSNNFPIYMGGVGAVGASAGLAGLDLLLDADEPFGLM